MMSCPIMTIEDITKRWQCSLPTVDARVKSGALKPCRKLPPGRFRYEDVLAAEGTEFSPLQPSERLRLERENEALRRENARLRSIVANVIGVVTPFLNEKGEP